MKRWIFFLLLPCLLWAQTNGYAAWGEASHGAALAIAADQDSFYRGALITLHCRLKNSSDHPFILKISGNPIVDSKIVLFDSGNNPLNLSPINAPQSAAISAQVNPGQSYDWDIPLKFSGAGSGFYHLQISRKFIAGSNAYEVTSNALQVELN